ncbi:MAG: hypothetical protein Q8Q04_00670 [archaeon]|nr:hypothetical protein [archaeon]
MEKKVLRVLKEWNKDAFEDGSSVPKRWAEVEINRKKSLKGKGKPVKSRKSEKRLIRALMDS